MSSAIWRIAYAFWKQGKIVERGTVDEIFDSPKEAYTQRLLSAIPSRDPAIQALLAQSRP